MKRLLLLLLAAGGAALWWRNRAANDVQSWSPEAAPAAPAEPPKLGGEVDAELLAILACPLDKQPDRFESQHIVQGHADSNWRRKAQ